MTRESLAAVQYMRIDPDPDSRHDYSLKNSRLDVTEVGVIMVNTEFEPVTHREDEITIIGSTQEDSNAKGVGRDRSCS